MDNLFAAILTSRRQLIDLRLYGFRFLGQEGIPSNISVTHGLHRCLHFLLVGLHQLFLRVSLKQHVGPFSNASVKPVTSQVNVSSKRELQERQPSIYG